MKLNILSDLHLGCGALEPPRNDADVVILAGDIARPRQAFAWAMELGKPVLYVAGNHEFYGASITGTGAALKQLCAGTNVHVLDNDQLIIDGVRFLGSTLWTDFMLWPDGEERSLAKREAQAFMRDFSVIQVDETVPRLFTPDDAAALCRADVQWLAGRLAEPHAGPTVVITHHAPSRQSIHPRFAGSRLNGCFVSDLAHLLDGQRAQLWVHGHTHDSFDYRLHGTRVVCNPRGYAKDGVNENPLFDSNLVVQIESARPGGTP
jgi:predicted phosphodiesterase